MTETRSDFLPAFTVQQILEAGVRILEAEKMPERPTMLDYVASVGLLLQFEYEIGNAHVIAHLHQVPIFRGVRSGIQLATIAELLALALREREDQ